MFCVYLHKTFEVLALSVREAKIASRVAPDRAGRAGL